MSKKPAPAVALRLVALALLGSGCAHGPTRATLAFDALEIQGDAALAKLNDEELFTKASAAFAAGEYAKAADLFGRVADLHPNSPHQATSVFNAGLSLEKLERWSEAAERFGALADAEKGQADRLEATFHLALAHYHLARYDEAGQLLQRLASRQDIPPGRRIEASVQLGICHIEAGRPDMGEALLREAIAKHATSDESEAVDLYFLAQAHFFLGELFRLRYEGVALDAEKVTSELAADLNLKSELLLSAQGHYLRAIRVGHGYWATASGAQIGELYQNLYEQMTRAPAPRELDAEAAQIYLQELRKKLRVLLHKAITIYEGTLEAAERVASRGHFIEKTRASLAKMKAMLLADAQSDPDADAAGDTPDSAAPEEAGAAGVSSGFAPKS
ncbi:MAG: tetratricopeptide repeat protein [Myxococcaceae bacterium]